MAPAPTISISSRASTLREIEPRPERLDRQLLEVMLSQHSSGLALIAAPNRPAEMRSFDPNVVTRLLDLVSSHFDYVVIDMPRTWFSWTDSVLVGSNKLFIISEMTVPGLRHAKQLVTAICERLGEGAASASHRQPFRAAHVRVRPAPRATSSRHWVTRSPARFPTIIALVREAIDRGIPLEEVKKGNNVVTELKKIVLPQPAKMEQRRKRVRKEGMEPVRCTLSAREASVKS